MHSMVLSLLQDETTIIRDSVSPGIFTCFGTRIVAYGYTPRLGALGYRMLDILERTVSLPNMGIEAECIGTILLSIGNVPSMHQWMYLVQS